jgi:hypothetical protein
MKKLLILTAALVLTSSAVGCRWCESWWRGSSATNGTVIMGAPSSCDPCAAPCSMPAPCAVPAACGYVAPR